MTTRVAGLWRDRELNPSPPPDMNPFKFNSVLCSGIGSTKTRKNGFVVRLDELPERFAHAKAHGSHLSIRFFITEFFIELRNSVGVELDLLFDCCISYQLSFLVNKGGIFTCRLVVIRHDFVKLE